MSITYAHLNNIRTSPPHYLDIGQYRKYLDLVADTVERLCFDDIRLHSETSNRIIATTRVYIVTAMTRNRSPQ